MPQMSLKELKEENEKEAQQAAEPAEEEVVEEPEVEEPEIEEPETEEPEPESEEEEGEPEPEPEVEPWMQADGDEPPPLSDSEAAKIRRKYKGKLQEEKAENEALRAEIEALKTKKPEIAAPEAKNKPKKADFENEEEFFEALADWKIENRDAQNQSKNVAEQQKAAQEAEQAAIGGEVDNHYLRAAKLAEKSGIKPENYQAADRRLRAAVEEKFPGGGDDVVDYLISTLGEGSEKVFYHLGVNQKRLSEFLETFDKGKGLRTAAFLGELNAELKAPSKRSTQAPDPGAQVQADSKSSASQSKLKKEYDEAHRSGNTAKAWKIKKQAKGLNVDTKNW